MKLSQQMKLYLVKRGENHVTVDKGWYSVELYSGHLKIILPVTGIRFEFIATA